MQKNETNYTTNKSQMDYYKANIEVQIEYLLFLNSFGFLSNRNYLELAPIIASIKDRLLSSFPYDFIPDTTYEVNNHIEQKLKEIIKESGNIEIEPCSDSYLLNADDIVNLSVANYLNNKIKNMPDITTTTNETKIANHVIYQMRKETPRANTHVSTIKDSCMPCFIESLRMKYDKEYCIQEYLYTCLHGLKIIEQVLNRETNSSADLVSFLNDLKAQFTIISNQGHLYTCLHSLKIIEQVLKRRTKSSVNLDSLLSELTKQFTITSNFSLTNAVEDLEARINEINNTEPASGVLLAKRPYYAKIEK